MLSRDDMREVILIAAVGPNRLIGDGSRLPWRLPRDFRLFRRLTMGHPIVMGRKTFQSIRSKPLPGRRNIVVSRNKSLVAEGCEVAHSVPEAIELTPPGSRVFVVGGGQIYEQAMAYATSIVLTEIFDESRNANLFTLFTGNVYFPTIEPSEWRETKTSKRSYLAIAEVSGYQSVKRKGLRFRVRRFIRIDSALQRSARLPESEIKQSLVIPRAAMQAPDGDDQRPLFD